MKPVTALLALTLVFLGCKHYIAAQDSPPTPPRIAVIPAPTAGDDKLTAALDLVKKAIDNLPTWEQDGLARFEQPELAAVRADIDACVEADPRSQADFLQLVDKLKTDAATLDALDLVLAKENLL